MGVTVTANLRDFLARLTREMAAETLRDLSDQQLVERILTGNTEAAFHTIVGRHGMMVYGVCWRMLQREHDAEDAFQATFLVLARKLRTVRKHSSLASWLHGVAHRTALKARAQTAARRRHERNAATHEAATDGKGELRAALDVELARLADKWRLPLLLCYLEGRTQDEAADHLGVSKNTLRNRLDEARRMLARRLTQRGVVWPAALTGVLLSDCIVLAAPGLFAKAVEAAAAVVTGKTAAVSTNVQALTKGVLKAMFLSKLKTPGVVILLMVGFIASGGGLVKQQASTAQPSESPSGATVVVAEPAYSQDGEEPKPSTDKRNRALSIEANAPGVSAGDRVDVVAARQNKIVGTDLKVLSVAASPGKPFSLTLQVSLEEAESLAAAQVDGPLNVTRRVSTIPAGYRLMGIRVLETDMVPVGTTVDVLCVIRKSEGITVQKVVEKVKVFAIETPADKAQATPVVVLAVTPEQVLRLNLAQQYGVLRLVSLLPEDSTEK